MHAVIDRFLPPGIIRSLAATWPAATSGHWHCYANGKLATKCPSSLPQAARIVLATMTALDTRALIGVDNAFPDVEHLHGAGLHQLTAGQDLGLHLDADRHPLLPWRREASAVLYLDSCDGGELELCDSVGNVTDRVACQPNRLVLFATPGQWHRVAKVHSVRRSLCLFFWSIDQHATGQSQAQFA